MGLVYYLSPEERAQRLESYWHNAEHIYQQITPYITAENIIDIVVPLAADMVFTGGVSALGAYLKEINAASKLSHEIRIIAQRLKHAVEDEPAFAAVEGMVLKMSDGMKDVKNVIKESTNELKQNIVKDAKQSIKQINSSLHEEIVPLNIKKFAKEEIEKAKFQLSLLDKNVEELSKSISHERVGELLNMGTHYTQFEKIEEETKMFYNLVRSTNEDINAISNNTKISKDILTQIKNHVFIEEHILRDGIIMRFHPHEDMAAAWKRLIEGNFMYSDLVLLQHEYAESFVMQGTKVPYDIAHEIVNKMYNWENLYK